MTDFEDDAREKAQETMHGGCGFFECVECGIKVLLSCSCQACHEECDYDEVVDRHPDDDLCSSCRNLAWGGTKP